MQRKVTRRIIIQKARHNAFPDESGHSALTACRHTVSGTISLPSRGTFHLSLTLLVRYRWQRVFSLIEWSRQIHTRFLVSRATWEYDRRPDPFAYQAITVCGLLFQNSSARIRFCNSGAGHTEPTRRIPRHPTRNACTLYSRTRFRLFPVRSPLLGESLLFSFPRGTKMFQFPRFPSLRYVCSRKDDPTLLGTGFPIRESPDQS